MKKRSVLCALVILALVFGLSVPALAAVDLGDPQFVVDDAGVLSPELEQKILETNEMLWNECSGAEFVVVTVNYAPAGLDQEEYAKKIFDTWHIGSAAEDNGLLLVLYTEADDFWLQPGEGVYSSPYVDEIAELVADDSAFYKAVLQDRDEDAVSALLEGVTKWYRAHYRSASGTSGSTGSVAYGGGSETEISDGAALLILVALVLVFIMLTSPFRCRLRWGRWGMWPFYYFSPWWPSRTRMIRPVRYVSSRPGSYRPSSTYTRPGSSSRPSGSRPSSSGGSFRSGGGRSSSGGFGSGRSSGGFSGRPGGGGRSGSGGFGHR